MFIYIDHILGQPVSTKQNTADSQRLKIYVQNVHHLREHMHSNDYATAQSLPRWRCARDDGVHGPATSTLSADVLSTFSVLSTHIMDPRAVDPLLKHTPDAVLHRIQIWRIRWAHLWRDKLWRLSAAWWQCHVHDVLVPHLAEKRSNPQKQSGYPAEAYLAELYSGNSHRWP